MALFQYILLLFLLFALSCATPRRSTRNSTNKVEKKYSELLGVSQDRISHKKLYVFLDDWYGVPYKYAGKTKKGVDCSGFAGVLYQEIYGRTLGGSSQGIYNQCQPISKSELLEGDLVFFKIETKDISHIGIYLQNNKFVHSSTKAGVVINDLNEEYYRKYYFASGRIK